MARPALPALPATLAQLKPRNAVSAGRLGGVLLPFPLVTSAEIAAVLRPGGRLRPDSALRTLRDNGLGGVAVSVVPRARNTARGRAVWYSSLMLDVARLYRWGDTEVASDVLAQANELAGHRGAHFVSEALSGGAGPQPDPLELDAATGGALSHLALLTASGRDRMMPRLRVRPATGTVVGRIGELAVVETEDGTRLGVPAPAEQPIIGALGAHVAVDAENLDGRSSVLWVRPAFQPRSERHARVPGGPSLLTDEQRQRVDRDVLLVG